MYVTVEGGVRSPAGSGKLPTEGKMRAIFINAVDRKVEEVQVENTLQAFYDKIGCETIEIIRLGGRYVLIVDEEGRLRNWKVGFRLVEGEGIAGNGLIVCGKSNGDFTDCHLPAGVVAEITEFLDLEKNPLPPPEFGVAFLPDLNPESITEAQREAQRDMERRRQR